MANALSRLLDQTTPVGVLDQTCDAHMFTTWVVTKCVWEFIKRNDAKNTYNIPKTIFGLES